jgi:hypothetical protein
MPGDVLGIKASSEASGSSAGASDAGAPVIEPPSAKLIVRLFLIPLLIVAAAVGVMLLIGLLAGGDKSIDQALNDLASTGGGERTGVFLGPASEERFSDANQIVQQMKAGMSTADRIKISAALVDILDNHSSVAEGKVQPALLLALGRVWQIDPEKPDDDSVKAQESRAAAMTELCKFLNNNKPEQIENRKAAVSAMGYWAGRSEVNSALPLLESRVADTNEDLDVRLVAATVLGPIGRAMMFPGNTSSTTAPSLPADPGILAALGAGLSESRPEEIELSWQSALSLAELDRTDVADTILMLLDRKSLAGKQVLDREADPQVFRPLTDLEQQRYLINTMIGVRNYPVAAVRQKIQSISDNDPSERVRVEAQETLGNSPATTQPAAK